MITVFLAAQYNTANDAQPTAEAIAVKAGKVSFVGENSGDWCEDNTSQNRKIINLAGNTLYPGFTDAHGHLLGIGLREMTLNLEGTNSVKDLQDKLKTASSGIEKGETIFGRGWIETHWPEMAY